MHFPQIANQFLDSPEALTLESMERRQMLDASNCKRVGLGLELKSLCSCGAHVLVGVPTAELFGILIDGVKDGGEPYINKLYKRFDEELPDQKQLQSKLDETIGVLISHYGEPVELKVEGF